MTQRYIMVDGEKLTKREVKKLVEFFDKECMEYAGKFFELCKSSNIPGADAGRSEKFRNFWNEVSVQCGGVDPQVCYVSSHYQNFAEETRIALAGLLARHDVTEHDKQRIHRALIVQQMFSEMSQHTPVQLLADSQTFAGDPHEVKKTAENFGNAPDQTAINQFMGSTAIH